MVEYNKRERERERERATEAGREKARETRGKRERDERDSEYLILCVELERLTAALRFNVARGVIEGDLPCQRCVPVR